MNFRFIILEYDECDSEQKQSKAYLFRAKGRYQVS